MNNDRISRCELFNRLATIPAPPEANEFKAEVYKVIQEMETETADIILCKDCKWLRHCETEDFEEYLDCDHPDGGGIPHNEEWFCADGERSE